MKLPDPVRRRVEERAEEMGLTALKRAADALSAAYREGRTLRLTDRERVTAYLVTRMPATYAAAVAVVGEVKERVGNIASVLDLGAGTGAVSLAVRQWFPAAQITMVERDTALSDAAREWLPHARVITDDVTRMSVLPAADLVIAGYSLGEFGAAISARMFDAARVAMAVIEPGTPKGFALIRELRDAMREHLIAPCPGAVPCPMTGDDWCHFAARVERSSMHRRVKGGELGYEDEKYSYVVVWKNGGTPAKSRIIRRPVQQPGLIVLETCTETGLATERVTKRDKEAFRKARHAAWGDAWI